MTPAAARPLPAITPFTFTTRAMGGRLTIHLAGLDDASRAAHDAAVVAARVGRWASRLTRHDPTSELSRLNAAQFGDARVGPTLAAAILAGSRAAEGTHSLVRLTLLDARLAAERSTPGVAHAAAPHARAATGPFRPGGDVEDEGWSLLADRRGALVRRPSTFRFDLDGVGKGWIADRAIDLLRAWPSAVVDADGDLAVRTAPGRRWEIAIDDPRQDWPSPDAPALALLQLPAPAVGFAVRWGVATSGTSVHRWTVDGEVRHHLIDPRTGRSAITDVVQATVIAASALRAEALAKAAVIAGSAEGFALLDRARVLGAVLLLERGDVLALPATEPFLLSSASSSGEAA